MKLHELNSAPEAKTRKRVGRGPGSGMGKTSTRGEKGQKLVVGQVFLLGSKVDNLLSIVEFQKEVLITNVLKLSLLQLI